jgi:hypothetical protein
MKKINVWFVGMKLGTAKENGDRDRVSVWFGLRSWNDITDEISKYDHVYIANTKQQAKETAELWNDNAKKAGRLNYDLL